MPELRLTLLVVGLLFLAGLAWWELRRPHQVRGSDLPRPVPEPPERSVDPAALNLRRSGDLELPRMSARYQDDQLPVVEVEPADFAALEARAESAPTPARDSPVAPEHVADEDVTEDFDDDFAEDVAAERPDHHPEAPVEPVMLATAAQPVSAAEPEAAVVTPATAGLEGFLDQLGAEQLADPPISDFEFGPAGPVEELAAQPAPPQMPSAPEPMASAPMAPEADVPGGDARSVVVDWPAPDASRVLAVRLLSIGERFSGRSVRLALAAEGFELGKFAIFHKPGPDGRALLSIASLNKPGTFESDSIDMQRYSGLNLFTVLPGPLPGPAAVDELLACAQILSQRLRATLQDGQGEQLTPSRTAVMRNLAAAAPT